MKRTLRRLALPLRLAVLAALAVYVGWTCRGTWTQLSWEFFRSSPLLAMSLIALACNVLLPAAKYARLYRRCGFPVAYRTALLLECATASLSLLTPGKAENLARAAVLAKRHGVRWAHSLAVSAYHLLTAFAALLAALAIWASAAGAISPAAGVAAVAATVSASALPLWVGRRTAWAGLDVLGRLTPWDHLAALLLSLPTVSTTPMFILALFAAHQIAAPPAEVVFRAMLLDLATQAPVSIAGIGLRETGVLVMFNGLAPASVLTAIGLLTTLFEKLFAAIVGLPLVSRLMLAAGGGERGAGSSPVADGAPGPAR